MRTGHVFHLKVNNVNTQYKMAFLALQNNAKRMLSFNIRNDGGTLPSTALPIFRSPEQARDFRDTVLKFTDTRSFVWTVSKCNESNEVTFHTRVCYKNDYDETIQMPSIYAKKFNVKDVRFIDTLIDNEIGCFVIDKYKLNMNTDQLIMDGSIWTPDLK